MSEQNEHKGTHSSHSKRDITIWEALGISWDILATVLILTMLFAFGGIMADRYAGTKYVFTITGFILLIIIGYRIIKKKASRIAKRLDDRNRTNDKPL